MIKVGLIGAGGVSRNHQAAWLKLKNAEPQAEIIGVADLVPERAQAAATRLGISHWTTNYFELLDWADVTAVDICTTENTHAQIAVDAAIRGKHILVEKPLTTTLNDADHLLETVDKHGVSLMPAHTHRFYDYSRSAKNTIDSGEIGTPIYIRYCSGGGFWRQDWSGNRISPVETGGNVLTNGVHIADLANWWLGAKPISVYAQARNLTSSHLEMYDYFMMTIKYDNDATAVIEMSRANMPRANSFMSISVLGTEGEIISGTEHTSQWLHDDDGFKFVGPDNQNGFDREIRAFANALTHNETPPVTGAAARLAVAMCLAAERSIQSGEVITLGKDL
ncbi:MAG: Gfo/Idh/MocA family oxidoreductase [Chloroflexi bacterium]|nr:Gfo/Idh/MocA family oxidoreductase [Chloroflexota bacterium]